MSFKFKTLISCISATFIAVVAIAGTLTSPEGVTTSTANFYTLNDIYQKLNLNTYSASGHSVTNPAVVATTSYTLSQIWSKIPTLNALTIATGTTIMGVPGMAKVLGNMGIGSVATAAQIASGYYAWGADGGTAIQGSLEVSSGPEWSAAESLASWNTASSVCSSLGAGWRVPTLTEVMVKHDSTPGFFTNSNYYWSTMSHLFSGQGFAWYEGPNFPVALDKATVGVLYMVKCVR